MSELRRILIVDDDIDYLVSMKMFLKGRYGVLTANSINDAINVFKENDCDLVLLDVGLGKENGLEGIEKIHSIHPSVGVAMLSGQKDVKLVVQAIRVGAVDYLTKPVSVDQIDEVMEKAVAARTVQEKCEALLQSQKSGKGSREIIHRSEVMKKLLNQAAQTKGHDANVLIIGETGTGKELLARFINRNEGNFRRPFIAVNCAAIPEHLLEAELFGHEAGAFTGASRRRIGKFELADGGDIFLDEISTMQLDLQVKLLRVIQEKEFCRLGSNTPIKANFRVIAACNRSLEEMVERGEFRIDLYHRLRVMQLSMPPLKDRTDDIPLLAEYFLSKFSGGNGANRKRFTDSAIERLSSYSWPGNVRELANVVQSLVIMNPGEIINEDAFPSWVMNGCQGMKGDVANTSCSNINSLPINTTFDVTMSLKEYTQKAEKEFIQRVLTFNDGDKGRAAYTLGIGRTTLYMKMKELGVK